MAMIRRMLLPLIAAAGSDAVHAQMLPVDHGGLALKRPLRFSMLQGALAPPPQRQARIYAVELAPSPAEPPAIAVAVQRRRNRLTAKPVRRIGTLALLPDTAADAQPRSSVTLIDAHGDIPLVDGMLATIGWQGVKLNNRGTNVTALYGSDAVKSRDLFLPSARLAFAAAPGLALRADYREGLQAYAGAGVSGALGLTREGFRSFQAGLRPERDSRVRLGVDWSAAPGLRLMFDAYDGDVRDRLAFVEHGYLPVNAGSAHIRGASVAAVHDLSSRLRWSLGYRAARVQRGDGGARQEREVALEALWSQGPWSCRAAVARSNAPALVPVTAGQADRVRVEAGIDYALAGPLPLRVGLHLADPGRLVSGRLVQDDISAAARAEDQARALMLTAALPL